MAIEKMRLIKTGGRIENLNKVLSVLYDSGCYHIQSSEAISAGLQAAAGAGKGKNPCTAVLDKLSAVSANLKYTPTKTDAPYNGSLDEAYSYLEKIKEQTDSLAALRNELTAETADYTQILTQINHFAKIDANIEDLLADGEVKIRIGKLPIDSYPKLKYYSSDNLLFEIFDKDDEYYWGVYFAPAARETDIDAIFNSMYFEKMNIPPYLFGSADKAVNGLKKLIETTRAEIDRIGDKLAAILDDEKSVLDSVYTRFSYENKIYELRKNAVTYNDSFFVFGYVPVNRADEIIELTGRIEGTNSVIITDDGEFDFVPPTKLKNNFLVRPFETIVKMYGIPRYGDMDPTSYVAIVYTLLFGIMFGDLGQGLVIALVGFIMAKWKKMEFGKILERIGLSSAVFGFFYGSVFGYEDLLDPLFVNVFGMKGKPIDVFEQSGMLLVAAIVLGAVLITVSIAINTVLCFKRGNYEDALFSDNGLAGLTFYVAVLLALALKFMFNKDILKPAYVLLLFILPLCLVFFKKPLGNLVMKRKPDGKFKIGEFLAESFFEMLEYVLSYATNTMSFLRVGGFILSHAGMMLVVMTLSEMVSEAASPVVVVLGNIFVLGLEGLIVGIQALRLQFYEVFGRFFDGSGVEYKPLGENTNK